jgi:hypothetical protein
MKLTRPLGHRLGFWVIVSIFTAGCADPQGQFDDFTERKAAIDADASTDAASLPDSRKPDLVNQNGSDAGQQCEIVTQSDMPQHYLFSLSTKIIKTKPILALTEFTISDLNGSPAISLHAQPLDATDKITPVGNPIVGGPFPIKPDGSFVADLGSVTVPGQANPISGSDIVSTLILNAQPGSVCSPANLICGPVDGVVSQPIAGFSLSDGSNFTFQAISDMSNYPKPVLDCSGSTAP